MKKQLPGLGLMVALALGAGCTVSEPALTHQPSRLDVIKRYAPDSPQSAAAWFLIGEAEHRMAQRFPVGTPEYVQNLVKPSEIPDWQGLSASDLEQDIEAAFAARTEFPWTQELDEKTFRMDVLPYRNGTNLLAQFPKAGVFWRKALTTRDGWGSLQKTYGLKTGWDELQSTLWTFAADYRSDPAKQREVLQNLIQYVNTKLWLETEGMRYHPSNAQEKTLEDIFTDKGGRCTDLTHLAVMSLRAWGVPATIARIPAWGKYDDNHQVVAVPHKTGWIVFDAIRPMPNKPGQSYWYSFGSAPKIYVEEFGFWGEDSARIRVDRARHPWFIDFYLGTRSCADRTNEFVPTTTIQVAGLEPKTDAYLGVLNNFCSQGIADIAVAAVASDGTASFKDMGCKSNILYFAKKDAIIAYENGTTEVLAGGAAQAANLADLMKPYKSYELYEWHDGSFALKGALTKVDSVRVLSANTAYAIKDPSEKVWSWQRPFVIHADGKLERF